MKKAQKLLALGIAASLAITLFAGCGTKESKPANADSKSGSAASTSAPVKKSKVKFAYFDFQQMPSMVEAVKNFQEANKNIEVEVNDISSKEYPDKMAILLAAGEDLDVYGIKNVMDFGGYYTKKQVLNVMDYIKKDNVDMKAFGGVENQLKGDDGNYYGLPIRGDYWVLYYNKDIFDKAKVAYPSGDMTWEDFRALAKKVTSGEGNDKIWGSYFHTWQSIPWSMSLPKKDGKLEDGKYEFLKPAYQIMLVMQNEDKSVMPYAEAKTSNAHYKAMFESGKLAMHVQGTWHIEQLITDKKAGKHNVNWGMTKAPYPAGGKPGISVGNVTGLGINSKTSNKDASWAFIKYMASAETAKTFAKYTQMPAAKTPDILSSFTKIEGFPAGGDKALEVAEVIPDGPVSPKSAAIGKILDEEHQLIMAGAKKLDEGIATMNKRVQELLAAK